MSGGAPAQVYQGMLLGPWLSRLGSKQMRSLSAKTSPRDLASIKELLGAGDVAPVIDRCYPLRQVAAALPYYGGGHARGKVVVTIGEQD